MVQYIITPWRSRSELLAVRSAFYPPAPSHKFLDVKSTTENDDATRRNAVSLVSVWAQRGNCPHTVESTALLMSAMLNDRPENSGYAVRGAYAAAFSRFVTGLLDGYQDKKHKMSMYSIASTINLPATFVELRHQCTHESLPSLKKLRAATERSLLWIWDFYWRTLELDEQVEAGDEDEMDGEGECRKVVAEYLRWRKIGRGNDDERVEFERRLGKWSKETVLGILMETGDGGAMDVGGLLQSVRLSRAILRGDKGSAAESEDDVPAAKGTMSMDELRAEMARAEESLDGDDDAEETQSCAKDVEEDVAGDDEEDIDEGSGWEMWKGPWIPKPIGIV